MDFSLAKFDIAQRVLLGLEKKSTFLQTQENQVI